MRVDNGRTAAKVGDLRNPKRGRVIIHTGHASLVCVLSVRFAMSWRNRDPQILRPKCRSNNRPVCTFVRALFSTSSIIPYNERTRMSLFSSTSRDPNPHCSRFFFLTTTANQSYQRKSLGISNFSSHSNINNFSKKKKNL